MGNNEIVLYSMSWFVERFAYMLFGFLIMVSMSNIFIQVMGSTYDQNSRCKETLYVKHLCKVGLRYAVIHRGRRLSFYSSTEDEYVWFCYKRPKEIRPDNTLSIDRLASKVDAMHG